MDEKKEEEMKEKSNHFQELVEKSSKTCAVILIEKLSKKGVDVAAFKDEIVQIVESTIMANYFMTAFLVM